MSHEDGVVGSDSGKQVTKDFEFLFSPFPLSLKGIVHNRPAQTK